MSRQPLPRPKLVIFDLDNTLYGYEPCNLAGQTAATDYICQTYKLNEDVVREAIKTARATVKKKTGDAAASHSRLLYYQHAFEMLGLNARLRDALASERLFWQVYLANMELAQGVMDVFQTIKAAQIPTAMITDLTTEIQIRKLMRLGIAEAFDYFVTSEECAGEKLSGHPYQALLDKAEVEKGNQLWMVGDAPADMAAAKHIGATTINMAEFTKKELDGSTVRVNNFADLDALLKSSAEA